MSRLLLFTLVVPTLSGCMFASHTLRREWIDNQRVVLKELTEWESDAPRLERIEIRWNLKSGVVRAVERQDYAVHVKQVVRHERIEQCRAEGAILGFWGTMPLSLLEIPVLPFDFLLMIPFFISGHRFDGFHCGYEYGSEPAYEVTDEWDFNEPRTRPAPETIIVVRQGAGGPEMARLVCDVDGSAEVTQRRVVEWSRGSSEALSFGSADHAALHDELNPTLALSSLTSKSPNWIAERDSAIPALEAGVRIDGRAIAIRFENKGPGMASQVAALLPENAGFACDVLAAGRINPGETRDMTIRLPTTHGHARIKFSEAFGRAPDPIDVEW